VYNATAQIEPGFTEMVSNCSGLPVCRCTPPTSLDQSSKHVRPPIGGSKSPHRSDKCPSLNKCEPLTSVNPGNDSSGPVSTGQTIVPLSIRRRSAALTSFAVLPESSWVAESAHEPHPHFSLELRCAVGVGVGWLALEAWFSHKQ
jgi:hypothetical protein